MSLLVIVSSKVGHFENFVGLSKPIPSPVVPSGDILKS